MMENPRSSDPPSTGTGCEKLPGFVKVGEVSHVGILKLGLSFHVELWSVRAQKEERNRISIEFHRSSRTRLGPLAGPAGLCRRTALPRGWSSLRECSVPNHREGAGIVVW